MNCMNWDLITFITILVLKKGDLVLQFLVKFNLKKLLETLDPLNLIKMEDI